MDTVNAERFEDYRPLMFSIAYRDDPNAHCAQVEIAY
jgi:hypothetical protein